jgi:protein-tyrosine phosphatase
MAAVIDLHTHILPGLDDGPANLPAAVAVAEVAFHGGTRTVAATPHLREDHPRVRPEELAGHVAALEEELRARGIGLQVVPGAEVDLDRADELDDSELAQATLAANGRDLLVEAPYHSLGGELPDRLHAVAGRGFRVTIAHPERCPDLAGDLDLLGELVEEGMLVQVTSRSLDKGGGIGKAAATVLERGWCHVLASDAHALDVRGPDLGSAVHRAQAAFPELEDELRWMVTDAPAAILAGEELPPRPPRRERRRRRLLRR